MDEIKCSFCGRSASRVERMLHSPWDESVHICSQCSNTLATVAGSESLGEALGLPPGGKSQQPQRRTPRQFRADLDRRVIGQDAAKKVLSVAMYNHFKRLRDETGMIQKSNILLAGPSGTGKTLLAKTMADILGLPCAIADATAMTAAGYAGDDVESCLQRLLLEAGGDLEKAQRGMVFIDEIDKLARGAEGLSENRDSMGRQVQTALLKLVEGAKVEVPLTGGRKTGNTKTVLFDTSRVLFIVGGAFDGMLREAEKSPERRVRPIGFCPGEEQQERPAHRSKLDQDALIRYGMMREFVGRFPNLVELRSLDEDDLVRILTEPDNAITKQYQALFLQDGVELRFTPEYLHGIARQALERGVGARGLRSLMEGTMMELMYDLPDRDGVTSCTLTADMLRTGEPVLGLEEPTFDLVTGKRRTYAKESLTLSA